MKAYKITYVFIIALFFNACESVLDLEPQQEISGEIALGTEENIKNVLNGAYYLNAERDIFGGRYQMASDLIGNSNQVQWSGTFIEPRQFFNKDIIVDNSFVNDFWRVSYRVIFSANAIIDNIEVVLSEDKNKIEGEAKFLRALNYFELVRNFGKQYGDGDNNLNLAVPLVLSSTEVKSGNQMFRARNSVQEVYDQVIADLTSAMTLLPTTNGYFANRYSAQALLSRVYLQMRDYQNALINAHEVINSQQFNLETSYENAFNKQTNGSEDIFAIQLNTQSGEGSNSLITFYANQANGGRDNDIVINDDFVELYNDPSDIRSSFFYFDSDERLTSKYTAQFANIGLIRLAELYLIRAECNLRAASSLGDTPLNDINRIRQRSSASPRITVALEDILLERQLELCFEGFLLHDLKRTNRNVGSIEWNANRLVLPIPLRELQANRNLVQNQGYGS